MNEAEKNSRKNRKPDASVDRLVLAARLGALSRELGIDIPRSRSVGNVTNSDPTRQHGAKSPDGEETIVLGKYF